MLHFREPTYVRKYIKRAVELGETLKTAFLSNDGVGQKYSLQTCLMAKLRREYCKLCESSLRVLRSITMKSCTLITWLNLNEIIHVHVFVIFITMIPN